MSTGLISKKHNNPKNKEEDRKMHKAEHQSYNNFKKEAPRDVRECSTPENFQLHSLQLDQIRQCGIEFQNITTPMTIKLPLPSKQFNNPLLKKRSHLCSHQTMK